MARRTISQEELRSSVALIQAVKEVTGSHAEVMVDAHDRFDVARVATLGSTDTRDVSDPLERQ